MRGHFRKHKTPSSLAGFCGVRAQMRSAFPTPPSFECIINCGLYYKFHVSPPVSPRIRFRRLHIAEVWWSLNNVSLKKVFSRSVLCQFWQKTAQTNSLCYNIVKPTINFTLARLGNLASERVYSRNCCSLKCKHIFGFYYNTTFLAMKSA